MEKKHSIHLVFALLILIFLIGSCILTVDRHTWILEVFPILIGLPLLMVTYKRFKFTNLVYFLIVLHSLILTVGGIYTYAEVPLGFWMQDWFGFTRNHFDRIGHFAQGFVPAIITRELLIRTSPLKPSKWLSFIVVCICLAISAFYEFIEWWAAAIQGASADAFLGTQGDEWDAQWDMFFAMTGAIACLVVLSKWHNKLLKKTDNMTL